jgi:hypothetical protein
MNSHGLPSMVPVLKCSWRMVPPSLFRRSGSRYATEDFDFLGQAVAIDDGAARDRGFRKRKDWQHGGECRCSAARRPCASPSRSKLFPHHRLCG